MEIHVANFLKIYKFVKGYACYLKLPDWDWTYFCNNLKPWIFLNDKYGVTLGKDTVCAMVNSALKVTKIQFTRSVYFFSDKSFSQIKISDVDSFGHFLTLSGRDEQKILWRKKIEL